MAAPHASPSRQRRATTYASTAPPATRRFGGLSAAAAPIRTPASTASVTRAGDERADDEEHGGEHEHHRREVGHRREPERLREELLDPALVVAIDEERDRGERRDDPQQRRPVAEQPTADARRDPVDAQERERAEDEHLREDERRAAPGRTSAR